MDDDLISDARQAGYSWDEIDDLQSQGGAAAADEGYSPEETRSYLGYAPTGPMEDMAGASWTGTLANDPDLKQAIQLANEPPDLTANPDWRAHYANAIDQRHVTSPQDFADRWAAAAVNAATNRGDDTGAAKQQAARAADAMVPQLPHGRDFIDGGLALTPDDPDLGRRNLIQNWKDTGQEPVQAIAAARLDPDTYAKLTAPLPEPPGFFDRFGTGIKDMFLGAGQLFVHALPKGFTDTVNDVFDATDAALGRAPAQRITPDVVDKLVAQRAKITAAEGYDGWVRWGGQLVATAPLFTTLGLEGLGGAVAAGLTGGAANAAFTPSTAEDFWSDKAAEILKGAGEGAVAGGALHGVFTGIGKVVSKMTPEAAAHLRDAAPDLLNPKVREVNPDAETPTREISVEEANRPVEPAALDLEGPDGRVANPISVYHASPHDFDRFDVQKINTGEGTQQEGHGLYFAENPDVHEAYKKSLGEFDPVLESEGLGHVLQPANSYRVNLHVDPNLMLHRDLPLGEQSPEVQQAVRNVYEKALAEHLKTVPEEDRAFTEQNEKAISLTLGDYRGKMAQDQIRQWMGEKQTSELLQKEGLHGIQYFDAGSKEAGQGTRNFVVFNDKRIEMLEKNGQKMFQIDPEASPAAKLQRIAQMHVEGEQFGKVDESAPNLHEQLYNAAVDQGHMASDPAVEALAVGHDTAAGMGNSWLDMVPGSLRRLLQDESGAMIIPAFQTPLQRAARAATAENRDFGRDLLIRAMGAYKQNERFWTGSLEKMRLALDPHLDEWRRELALGPAGNPRSTVVGQFLDSIENYSKGVRMAPDHPLAPWVDVARTFNQMTERELRVRDANPDNPLTFNSSIQDYLAHMFVDPAQAMQHFGVGTGKTGSKANLLERKGFPTILDAVESGVQLKHDDPFDLIMNDMHSKYRLMSYADAVEDAQNRGYLKWNQAKAPGDVPLDTAFGRKYARDASGQTVLDANGNPVELQLYGHPMLIKQIRNWLDNGMYAKPETTGKILDAVTYAKNTLTGLKLAFPAFHASVVAMGSIAGSIGRGLEGTGRGWLTGDMKVMGEALKDLALAPVAPVRDWMASRPAAIAYAKQINDPAFSLLVDQNFNFGSAHAIERVQGTTPNIFQSILAGRSLGEFLKAPDLGLLPREVRNNFASILGDAKTEAEGMRYARMPDRAIQAVINEGQRALSTVNGPLFDHLIPRLKLGQAMQRMQRFLEANPMATDEAKATYARQVTQDVDNRLGELQLDNLFWSRTAKQAINAATISTSWTYGTYRGFASAFGLDIERHAFQFNPVATSNLVGTAVTLAMANALLGYMQGQPPKDWHDLINFRTGGFGSGMMKARPERGLVPTEWKELYDIGSIVAKSWQQPTKAPAGALDYAMGKLNPFWQFIRAAVTGQDAIGNDIALQPGGWRRFLADQMNPIALGQSGLIEGMDYRTKQTGLSRAENFLGIREVPKWSEDWSRYQGEGKQGLHGVYSKIEADQIKRARREVGDMENAPWWAKQIPPATTRPPNAQQRALQQYEQTGSMSGITNPRTARYLNVLRDAAKDRQDPLYDPARDKLMGNTLNDRLRRARRAGAFDPVRGY